MNERLIKKQKQTDTSNESTSEQFVNLCITPLKFNSSPLKKGWLEDDPFLLGFSNFSGDSFWTFAGGGCNFSKKLPKWWWKMVIYEW